jgi:hypothetical protein
MVVLIMKIQESLCRFEAQKPGLEDLPALGEIIVELLHSLSTSS